MILHVDGNRHQVSTLLDTGCSIPLISQPTVQKLRIKYKTHETPRRMESFTGETVENTGQFYTEPMRVQHRNHFSNEQFKVSPMEEAIDLFLPFKWIERHPPQGIWTSEEIRFNSPACLEKCTHYETAMFSLTWDESVCTDLTTQTLGQVSTASDKPLEKLPEEFWQFLDKMGKEAADALPEHRPYDCKIELKEGTTAPWGPIYPLSEEELRTLREWLKEMERMGKIQRSTSPAGSPILFVPKPNGRRLRLCVDYRGLNAITIPNRYPVPLMQELQD